MLLTQLHAFVDFRDTRFGMQSVILGCDKINIRIHFEHNVVTISKKHFDFDTTLCPFQKNISIWSHCCDYFKKMKNNCHSFCNLDLIYHIPPWIWWKHFFDFIKNFHKNEVGKAKIYPGRFTTSCARLRKEQTRIDILGKFGLAYLRNYLEIK